MGESPRYTYREEPTLHEQVVQAVAFYGTTVGGDIVAHHTELVRRWKRDKAKRPASKEMTEWQIKLHSAPVGAKARIYIGPRAGILIKGSNLNWHWDTPIPPGCKAEYPTDYLAALFEMSGNTGTAILYPFETEAAS